MFPFDGTDSSSTITADRNNNFKPRTPFDNGNDPNIPIVSMKTLDQRPPRQSESFFNFSMGIGTNNKNSQRNDTNSVFDLAQFGIKDEAPVQNTTLTNMTGTFQNVIAYNENINTATLGDSQPETKLEYPFGAFQNNDNERKTARSQKGPSIRVISGFKDHANKPVLLSKGTFIDFTAGNGPGSDNSRTDNSTDKLKSTNNTTNTVDTNTPLLGGLALPGVQGRDNSNRQLSPLQVKPFKPFVTEPTPASNTVVSKATSATASSTTSIRNKSSVGNDNMDSQMTHKGNNAGDSVNVPGPESDINVGSSTGSSPDTDSNSIPNINRNNKLLAGFSVAGNTGSVGDNTNIGGALVNNHINADDITNDLFNNRVTGPVPDGIPAGEKLKIDNIYPVVSNARRNNPTINAVDSPTSSSDTSPDVTGITNDPRSIGITLNGSASNLQATGIIPSSNTVTVNNQGNSANNQAGPMSNDIIDKGVPNNNPNIRSGMPANMNNAVNTNAVPAGPTNPGLPINGFSGGNSQLINNNNVMPGQNWQGQINPTLTNQTVNRNFVNTGGQQILNNQVFNNGIPDQRLPTNIGNSFPVLGNNNGQNRLANFPNTLLTQNGQLIQGGINSNTVPNVFNNVQDRFNSPTGIRTVPGSNANQFNNLQRGMVQIPFGQNVNNNGFRTIRGNAPTGFQNRATLNEIQNMGIQNPFFNSQIPSNTVMQGNEPRNPFITDQSNRNIVINGNVAQPNVNTNRENVIANQNRNTMTVNPNTIAANNRVASNQAGTGLISNTMLNNEINPGQVTNIVIPGSSNDDSSLSNNIVDRQTNAGISNANIPGTNELPGNFNKGLPSINAGGPLRDQSQTNFQNNQMNLNNQILPGNGFNTQTQTTGNSNVANIQQNIQNGRTTTSDQIGTNQGLPLLVGPDGQMLTTNNQQVNQQNIFVGPNGPASTNMIPNIPITNNVPIETLQQRIGQRISSTGVPTQPRGNVIGNTQNNENMPNLNPNQMNQNMQNLNPNGMNQNMQNLNPNQMNQNVQNLNPNQMNQNVQNLNPNGMNQNVQNLNPNGMNQNVQNLNPNQMNQNVQDLNPNQMNQNVQNLNPNQMNQNALNQNINTQQMTGQNGVQNNLVNPNLENRNMNLQQMTGRNRIQNIPNTQISNNFGINNGFRRQNSPQNMFPSFVQNSGFQNRFQNTGGFPNVPAIGQNPTFISGPVNNFQTPFANGPSRNFPGQFLNGFPNNAGQFRQPINTGVGR